MMTRQSLLVDRSARAQLSQMFPTIRTLQDQLIAAMSPERKIALSEELRRDAWSLKAAWMRAQHPEMAEEEIQKRVGQVFLDAGS